MTVPNKKNFCGGNFQDWLEVCLTDKCNGRCSWCIEKNGYKPKHHATPARIADAAIATGKTNIILLGGEPTLYPDHDMVCLIGYLTAANKKVWITTNGSRLTREYVRRVLQDVTGVNISVHCYNLNHNHEITGLDLSEDNLREAIDELHRIDGNMSSVRMNCNIIKNEIDSAEQIVRYVRWAKSIGADKIRFAELKDDEDDFVDLAAILNHKYGLNDNPFVEGCHSDAVIEGVPVNFRQMCGLQTSRRCAPDSPEQHVKEVLYYDGLLYRGWQKEKEEIEVDDKKLIALLQDVADHKISVAEAAILLVKDGMSNSRELSRPGSSAKIVTDESAGGCQY